MKKKISIVAATLLVSQACFAFTPGDIADARMMLNEQREVLFDANAPTIACELLKNGKWTLSTEEECIKDKSAKKEVAYLKQMFSEVADAAPKNLKTKYSGTVNLGKEMREQTFLINHSWREITEQYMGFGPEDDKAYNYKHSQYFSSDNPQGTIKINLTERAYELVKLYYDYVVPTYGKDSKVAKGMIAFFNMLFSHESLHGYQLKTGPVLDFKRYDMAQLKSELAARNLSPKVVKGSGKIVDYEEDALRLDNMILADKTNIEMMEALVAEFAKWKGNAKLMANYPLLAKTNGNGENTFYNYYMLDTLNSSKESYAMLKKGGDVKSFSGLTYYTYNVQKIPLLTVAYMIELNNKIAAGAPCSKHKYEADKAEYFAREVAEPYFNRDLGNGRDDSATIDAIKGAAEGFSGLDEIKEAMYKEFDLFKKQCK